MVTTNVKTRALNVEGTWNYRAEEVEKQQKYP